jgi:phosphate transport system permease protein
LSPSPFNSNGLTAAITCVMAACGIAVLTVVILFVAREAWPAVGQIGLSRFLTDTSWHPTEGAFGLSPMLVATLASSIGAVFLAVPMGVAAALFCRYFAPPGLASAYKKLLGLFAGIPSVVYGFWGLTVLVPLIAEHRPPGASLAAGILILALMIFPTVALTSEAALSQVPPGYLLGGYALGFSKATTTLKIGLYAARAGVLSGTILALARALGETMAVLMVCGNVVQSPQSIFAPVRTLSANIALEMAYALGEHRSALFVSGCFLIVIVVVLILLSEYVSWKREYA